MFRSSSSRHIARAVLVVPVLVTAVLAQPPQQMPAVLSPAADDSEVLFGVVGDMGTGNSRQYETAAMMAKVRERFPFSFVITVGDNMYGGQSARDYARKFEIPYKALLDQGVMFYSALGNHDEPAQRFYKPMNMNGERYYTYRKGPVRFFALDSTYFSPEQHRWLEGELAKADTPWRIVYMHHPIYSSGRRHGAEMDLRKALEPLLITYKVQAVFAGHEHFYERYTPQHGVQHFISGAGGQIRIFNIRRTPDTAAAFDTDNSFMVVRVRDGEMYFESVSRLGRVVDAGVVEQQGGTRALSVAPTGAQ